MKENLKMMFLDEHFGPKREKERREKPCF